MANGTVLRGEVYWVSIDNTVGSEIQTGRPAVIVSGDKANEVLPTVIVAFVSTQSRPAPTNVSINLNGEFNRVICNQIRTIDKQRLTRYVGKLSNSELVRVTGALAGALCIPLATKQLEKEEDPEKIALKAECDMWKRLYDVTMTQLVEVKMNADLARRMEEEYEPELESVEEPEPESEPEEQPKVEVEFEPEPELTDINSCDFAALKRLGFSTNIALTIIEGRPYKAISEIRSLPGLTSIMYQLVEKKICCNPVVTESVVVEETPVVETVETPRVEEKININTATGKELREKLGLSQTYAYAITGYRNKNGRFVELEELLDVKYLGERFLDKYRDRLTLGDDKEEVPEEPMAGDDKVNVNTATVDEIVAGTGMGKQTAYAIVLYRNKNGPFRKMEDLLKVQRFGEGCMRTYGDMLTIGEIEDEEEPEQQEDEKVNINTATIYELMAVGFEKRAAALIVNERKKYGSFRNLDELADLPEISGKILRKLRDKLEV